MTARREATVSAQITGTLTQVLIEEGDHVKAGQVLARLDDTAQRAALAQAQAQLQSAQALLVQYQAQLAQSAARPEARRGPGRAQAGLRSRRSSRRAPRSMTQSAQVRGAAQADRSGAGRACAGAQVQLDYCTSCARRSPASSSPRPRRSGEIVSPISAGGGFTRTGIGTIVDMDSLEIEVDVNEAYINRVQPGQPVEAVLDAYPDWKIPAHVIAIIPTADRSKATVKVRIASGPEGPAHRAGHGRARLLPRGGAKAGAAGTRRRRKGVLVPATAIVRARRAERGVRRSTAVARTARVRSAPGQGYGELRLVDGLSPPARSVVRGAAARSCTTARRSAFARTRVRRP